MSSSNETQFENIKFEKKNQIAYVTVTRPKVLNALNMATMSELHQAFSMVRVDDDIRVAILSGDGPKAFIAGADINELSTQGPVEGKEYAQRGQAVLDLIENCGKPVIAVASPQQVIENGCRSVCSSGDPAHAAANAVISSCSSCSYR